MNRDHEKANINRSYIKPPASIEISRHYNPGSINDILSNNGGSVRKLKKRGPLLLPRASEKFPSLEREIPRNGSELNLRLPEICSSKASREHTDMSIGRTTEERQESLRVKLEALYAQKPKKLRPQLRQYTEMSKPPLMAGKYLLGDNKKRAHQMLISPHNRAGVGVNPKYGGSLISSDRAMP